MSEIELLWGRPGWPGCACSPVPTQHQPADTLALDDIELEHELGVKRHAVIVVERDPVLLAGLVVDHPHCMRTILRSVMGHVEAAKNVDLALQPLPPNQSSCGE